MAQAEAVNGDQHGHRSRLRRADTLAG
jgi:hypothetical protein